jgi:8-oxo-dGTP pyrophosphatase MutT (NUDIX family)
MTSWLLRDIRARLAAPRALAHAEDQAAAAVAAILRDGAEGAELLVIKRAEREGDPWSGHLAFPGGKREPSDASLLATSVRETREEIGLRLGDAAYVARLDDVFARTNGFRVAQFVFALDETEVALVPSPEVSETFWVPLARLARLEGAETMKYGALELPSLRIASHVLWGMTYRMVMQLLEAIDQGMQ